MGMRLALSRPDLLKSLTQICTSAESETAENLCRYRLLSLVAKLTGLGPLVGQVLPSVSEMFPRSRTVKKSNEWQLRRLRELVTWF